MRLNFRLNGYIYANMYGLLDGENRGIIILLCITVDQYRVNSANSKVVDSIILHIKGKIANIVSNKFRDLCNVKQ